MKLEHNLPRTAKNSGSSRFLMTAVFLYANLFPYFSMTTSLTFGRIGVCKRVREIDIYRGRYVYRYIKLREMPELETSAAEWFYNKWRVPREAYLECMDDYLNYKTEYGWYLCMDNEQSFRCKEGCTGEEKEAVVAFLGNVKCVKIKGGDRDKREGNHHD